MKSKCSSEELDLNILVFYTKVAELAEMLVKNAMICLLR